jgi:hypothetical protein
MAQIAHDSHRLDHHHGHLLDRRSHAGVDSRERILVESEIVNFQHQFCVLNFEMKKQTFSRFGCICIAAAPAASIA